jgi:hypothetical protein
MVTKDPFPPLEPPVPPNAAATQAGPRTAHASGGSLATARSRASADLRRDRATSSPGAVVCRSGRERSVR